MESFDQLFGQPDRSTLLHSAICPIVCQCMSTKFAHSLDDFQTICCGFIGNLRTGLTSSKMSMAGSNDVGLASCRYYEGRYTGTRPMCSFLNFNFFLPCSAGGGSTVGAGTLEGTCPITRLIRN
jgi:hypothetical protein